jgi:hypothetical protein
MAYNQPEEIIYLSTQTASNSASLSFTSLITTTYPVYFIKVRNIVPATDTDNFLLTFSTDNGSTYLNSAYQWSQIGVTEASFTSTQFNNSDSSIQLTPAMSSTANRGGLSGQMYLYGFAVAKVPQISLEAFNYDSNTHANYRITYGANTGTTAVNAIKFACSSGNITSGSIILYGMTL